MPAFYCLSAKRIQRSRLNLSRHIFSRGNSCFYVPHSFFMPCWNVFYSNSLKNPNAYKALFPGNGATWPFPSMYCFRLSCLFFMGEIFRWIFKEIGEKPTVPPFTACFPLKHSKPFHNFCKNTISLKHAQSPTKTWKQHQPFRFHKQLSSSSENPSIDIIQVSTAIRFPPIQNFPVSKTFLYLTMRLPQPMRQATLFDTFCPFQASMILATGTKRLSFPLFSRLPDTM